MRSVSIRAVDERVCAELFCDREALFVQAMKKNKGMMDDQKT
jgi:hypothetical protein